jgi:hypothetical protein
MSDSSTPARHRIAELEAGGEPIHRRTTDATVTAWVWVAAVGQRRADMTDSRALRFTVQPDGVWTVAVREPGPGHGHPGPVTIASGHVDGTHDPAEDVNADAVLAVYENNRDSREFVRALLAGVAGIAAQAQRDARTAREQLANAYTREAVAEMDANAVDVLHGLLSDRMDDDAPQDFAETVRDALADQGARWVDAVTVRFPANNDYTDGWWYEQTAAVVTLADGTEHDYNFDRTGVEEQLDALSGVVRRSGTIGRDSVLQVDLKTGEVTHG